MYIYREKDRCVYTYIHRYMYIHTHRIRNLVGNIVLHVCIASSCNARR